jgi:hypothetical protein
MHKVSIMGGGGLRYDVLATVTKQCLTHFWGYVIEEPLLSNNSESYKSLFLTHTGNQNHYIEDVIEHTGLSFREGWLHKVYTQDTAPVVT